MAGQRMGGSIRATRNMVVLASVVAACSGAASPPPATSSPTPQPSFTREDLVACQAVDKRDDDSLRQLEVAAGLRSSAATTIEIGQDRTIFLGILKGALSAAL